MQYIRKADIVFNINLNNYQKDVLEPYAIPENPHISDKNHNFNTHAKFIQIEEIHHIDIDKEKK